MTDPLDTLRALEAAATPGPWVVDSEDPTARRSTRGTLEETT